MDNNINDALAASGKQDSFYTKASQHIEKAEEGAWDKSIFNNRDDFVMHYADEILGEKDLIFGLSIKNNNISTEEFFEKAIDSGFIKEDEVTDFQEIFDQDGNGKFSRKEITDLLDVAYDAYSEQNINPNIVTTTEGVPTANIVTQTVSPPEDIITTTDAVDVPYDVIDELEDPLPTCPTPPYEPEVYPTTTD